MKNILFLFTIFSLISCKTEKTNKITEVKRSNKIISKIIERKYAYSTGNKKMIIETHSEFNDFGKLLSNTEYRNYSTKSNPNLPLERLTFTKYYYNENSELIKEEEIDENNKISQLKTFEKIDNRTLYKTFKNNILIQKGEIIYNSKKQILRETIDLFGPDYLTQKKTVITKIYDENGNLIIDEITHIDKENKSETHKQELEYKNNLLIKFKNGLTEGTDIIYKYEFDNYNNWILRNEMGEGENNPIITTEREISYK